MEVRSAVCDASNAEENHDKENNDPSVVILRILSHHLARSNMRTPQTAAKNVHAAQIRQSIPATGGVAEGPLDNCFSLLTEMAGCSI